MKFGNTALYRDRKIIEGRFFLAVLEIVKLSDGYDYKKSVLQFRDVLRLSEPDYGRLPVSNHTADRSCKFQCVLHLLYSFVSLYWASRDCKDLDKATEPRLEQLELLAAEGLKVFDVVGNLETGYFLVRKDK